MQQSMWGKHQLEVALGSNGELFAEPNQARAIARLAKRLGKLGCERVLIEGGSYQNVLVAALRAAELPEVIINLAPRSGNLPRALVNWPRPTISTRGYWRFTANAFSRQCENFPDEQNQVLRGLWVRREQLIEMLVMEENRFSSNAPKALHRSLVTG